MTSSPLKILVLSPFDGRDANVVRDFLFSFNAHSIHEYFYIFDCRILDRNMAFSFFDVILIFWSIYLPGSDLSESVQEMIRQSPALKVLFLQDEYRDVRVFNQIMNRLGIQIMFTCVAERDHTTFYPQELIPSLQATYTVLTGYVPTYLENYRPDYSQAHRPLDIGYRSRAVPYYLGDLAQEKRIVAERFQKISLEYGFTSDISVREQDRIYGNRWVKFLKASRFVLGTPSGASVIDFTGEIRRNCEEYLYLHPNATYEEVKQRFFAEMDWKVVIDTVSPRIFETAALCCTMVMHEGEYGGILQSGRHYISIKKDYSNLNDVIAQMRDKKYCSELSRNAYHDLIENGNYSYRTFAQRFDSILAKHINSFVRQRTITKTAFYVNNYLRYVEGIIPYGDRFFVLPFTSLYKKVLWLNNILRKLAMAVAPPGFMKLLIMSYRKRLWNLDWLGQIFKDFVSLSLLYHLNSKKMEATKPFWVEVQFDPALPELILISHPIKIYDQNKSSDKTGYCTNLSFSPSLLEIFIMEGRRIMFKWDHSSMGSEIILVSPTKTKERITVYLENLKYHNFETFPYCIQHFPSQAWAVLSRVLNITNE